MPLRFDRMIVEFDRALRAIAAPASPLRPIPASAIETSVLDENERRHAAGLMRVNHVGEICAQALYHAQALATRNPELRTHLDAAARDESDHLAWTAARLAELESRTSLLNPLWYAGAFALGYLAGKAGDATSLALVVETERQVERHLAGHLDRLPANDAASRAIVAAMRDDEMRHGAQACEQGAAELPGPVKLAMRGAARLMTASAYWI